MSESTTKKLRAEVARLRERIDVHRNKEIKLLDDILQLREENRRLRVAYRRAVGEGMAVWEYGRDKLADKEVAAVMEEITR